MSCSCGPALDYLPEPFVVPVVEHLFSAMNPGGQVLAFFHTRPQGEETVHCRFHLTAGDDVEMQFAQQFPIQRVFTNRSIERLFAPGPASSNSWPKTASSKPYYPLDLSSGPIPRGADP